MSVKTKLNHYIIGRPVPKPEPQQEHLQKQKTKKEKTKKEKEKHKEPPKEAAPAPKVHRCDVCEINFNGEKTTERALSREETHGAGAAAYTGAGASCG